MEEDKNEMLYMQVWNRTLKAHGWFGNNAEPVKVVDVVIYAMLRLLYHKNKYLRILNRIIV